ncbi:MAG: hypothetical protein NT069_10040 [Planctomycetota bacterium]|nr:hypothetical protein [Planctomycetota bacterium]
MSSIRISLSVFVLSLFGAVTAKVAETAGLEHERIAALAGVEQLDKLDERSAIVLIHSPAGPFRLETIPLP